MLTSLTLRSVATYPAEGVAISGLQPISFIFGSNGSGKTTLSNCIASPATEDFKDCEMLWANGEPLAVYVYNKRFREANLRQADIPGVFTMGEDSVARLEERKAKDEELKTLRATATQQRDKVAEYKANAEKETTRFTDLIWDKHYKPSKDKFAPAFKGASRTLTFRDAQGRAVLRQRVRAGQRSVTVGTVGLAAGVYTLRLWSDDAVAGWEKVVVQ